MKYTFHNSYVILQPVPSTAILLAQGLIKQGYVVPRLRSSLQILHGRHHELVDRPETSLFQMTMDLFTKRFSFPYHRQGLYRTWLWVKQWVSYKNQELFTLCEHPGSPQIFDGVRVAYLFSFLCFLGFLFCFSSLLCHVHTITCVNSWLSLRFSLIFLYYYNILLKEN